MTTPTVGVVVLAYTDEPYLAECVTSVLAARDVDVRLVLVDNTCTPADLQAAVDAAGDDPRLTVLRPGRNTGFAGGCNLGVAQLVSCTGDPGHESADPDGSSQGAARSSDRVSLQGRQRREGPSGPSNHAVDLRCWTPGTDFVALVNSDCVLEPDALALLVAEAARPGVGPVMASVRLADQPELINSAGNPVHLVGLSWAGEMNQRETRTEPFDVTGASGACVLLAASVWKALDGFDEEYFAYLEDTELSLRCWRTGLAARCVPTAVARHHYEFSRNANKMYLLERNRLMLLATVWPARALALLAPLLVAIEALLTVYAVASGWGGGKVRGWVWLWRNRAHVAARRRLVQGELSVPDREWMARLTPNLDPQAIGPAPLTKVANVGFRAYWAVARRLL